MPIDDDAADVLSHAEMTIREGTTLQKGMNYRPSGHKYSIFLMNVADNAPYQDGFDEAGEVLTYEGHDITRREQDQPKKFDQPLFTKSGKLTENGRFYQAVEDFRAGRRPNPEKIRVYEKITNNVWSDKGFFYLVDAAFVDAESEGRRVVRYKLTPEELHLENHTIEESLEFSRRIPTTVKRLVWERDAGKCRECGAVTDLHFDHILPYSKGGTSTNPDNIQLLCQKHNLSKSDKIL